MKKMIIVLLGVAFVLNLVIVILYADAGTKIGT